MAVYFSRLQFYHSLMTCPSRIMTRDDQNSSYQVRSWCSLRKEQEEVFHDIAEKRCGMSTINYKFHVNHNARTLPPPSPSAPALYNQTLSLLKYGQWCIYWRKFSNFILLLKYWKILFEDTRPYKSHGIHHVTGWMGFLRILKYIIFPSWPLGMFLICLVRYMFNKSSWKVHYHNVPKSRNTPPPPFLTSR